MNWLEFPAGKYSLLKGKDKKSQCQIELSIRYYMRSDVISLFDGTDGGQIRSAHISSTRR